MAKCTIAGALNMAMAHELANDDAVVIFGEDVGLNGGVFRVTQGLQERFGEKRCFDTPLAENMIAGMAVGMACQGLKPIAEAQFMGFIYPTVDQMISHAGRMRNRTRGRLTCPMVLRAPYGGGIHPPEHHSESTEALFAHMPGVRVVIPSNPARAYGLLLAAIREPDPVVFLEPKRLYQSPKADVEDDGEEYPLDACLISREGSDITLVSWGAMMKETEEAADALAKEGIGAEVIDVATVKPVDTETIVESVRKTGRCVVVQEAVQTCSVGSEIAATVAEEAIYELLTPVKRVTGYDVIFPLAKLEHYYMPSTQRVINAAREALEE